MSWNMLECLPTWNIVDCTEFMLIHVENPTVGQSVHNLCYDGGVRPPRLAKSQPTQSSRAGLPTH